tara:strand:+ start:5602 stop:5706 length:105 start_codon:yes stop_codon:yes gene_type:complete
MKLTKAIKLYKLLKMLKIAIGKYDKNIKVPKKQP